MKRDSRGRFAQVGSTPRPTKKKKTAAYTIATPKPFPVQTELINLVAFVIDQSGSMGHLRNDVVTNYNEQLRSLKAVAMRTGQKTVVSTYLFSGSHVRMTVPTLVEWAPELRSNQYNPGGGTALLDTVDSVVSDLLSDPQANNPNTSFLLITLTDGEENQSYRCKGQCFKDLIKRTTATDRWTYTFLTPESGRRTLEVLGIAPGNIQTWEATTQGYTYATQSVNRGINTYYAARGAGGQSVSSFYTPDLTNVSAAAMKRKLDDASQDFLRLSVPVDSRIDTFVPQTTGNPYVTGSGFYQLTKSEKIQDYKGLVIQDTRDNKLYSGITNREDLKEVRSMLGLPADATITVRPAKHPTYNIFVQSGSRNRKLIGGTTLLLDKSKV